MNILSRYVLHEFVKLVLLAVTTLITLFVLINFFENIDEYINNHVPLSTIIRYYLFMVPQIFFLMAPNAILVATAVCISNLQRNQELTAMRAGGISLLSITTPILLVSFIVSLFSMISNEFVTPFTNRKANHIVTVEVRKGHARSIIQENKIWYHSMNKTIWNIEYLDSRTRTFKGVHIYFSEPGKPMSMRLDASSAFHDGKSWVFEDVYVRRFDDSRPTETRHYAKQRFQLDEMPEDFIRVERKQNEMSMRHVYNYREKLKKEGLDSTRYDVDLHYKLSYPFICLIMALIGIPFSLRSNRSGGVVFSIGSSIVVGFIYFYLFSMSISIGYGGALPAWLAAWGMNIIALSAGFYMLLTIDSTVSVPYFQK